MKSALIAILLIGSYAHAQDAAAVAAPDIVTNAETFISVHLMAMVGGIAMLLEILMRFMKTQKPMSWLYLASAICHWVGDLAAMIGKFFDGLIQNLNASAAITQTATVAVTTVKSIENSAVQSVETEAIKAVETSVVSKL